MRVLFVHQNFPGQFLHLAPALAKRPGWQVHALGLGKPMNFGGVIVHRYELQRGTGRDTHPWFQDAETKVIRGEAAMRAAFALRDSGFSPDLIIAHPGWGESLFLKNVWPKARLAIYCEFFYKQRDGDVDFDPEFPIDPATTGPRILLKNINNLLHMEVADAGISPTAWQRSTFPERFREHISVIHDGIRTELACPNPAAYVSMADGTRLSREDEVITFVNRNLEPYRGYHIFMRSLPEILRSRPKAKVLIVGGDGVSYGAAAPPQQTWKDIFLREVGDQIDLSRVHFLGHVPYEHFIPILQISRVHVYLTYPFVLSWSLLEAMSIECAIVASDTAPLKEVIQHDITGRMVDFFDTQALAQQVTELLGDEEARKRLGRAAREFVCKNFDLQTVCLPRQLAWVDQLLAK